MSDAHAKRELRAAVAHRRFCGVRLTPQAVDVLQHALLALEDRARLVAGIESVVREINGDSPPLVAAARCHMRGEG